MLPEQSHLRNNLLDLSAAQCDIMASIVMHHLTVLLLTFHPLDSFLILTEDLNLSNKVLSFTSLLASALGDPG